VGEPDFDTPAHVVDAAAEASRAGATHYTSNAGLPDLRAAIAETMAREHAVRIAPDQVLVSTGGMEALHLALLVVAGPGDEVVIPTPGWPNYLTQAKLADAVPVEVPLPRERGFELDPERVVERIGEDTAAVVLSTPSNPTGQVFDPDAVHAVVDAAAENEAFVIADQVYSRLTYEGSQRAIAAYTDHPDRVLTVDSFSKTYAMTGWRVGWLAGPADVIDAATAIRESTTACTSTPAQHAGLAALTGPQDPIREMYEAFRERRDYVVERVGAIPGISAPCPEGAFYAFLDVRSLEGTSMEIAKRLLEEYGVVVAPGGGFGEAGEGHLRLSFANSLERLETGFDRIEAMVRNETS
jgi:aspartate aminotransferase